ncbi:MAG: hypothetical protein JO202_13100 [Ktedonobacteraceae bacterium]|nr:hypothetical protein [Ktedonobacteraceae bacterium]
MAMSEVAQIRQRIEQELEAMRLGMSGLAMGVARHSFIHARMERIGEYQDKLTEHVGEKSANKIVCALYMQAMQEEVPDDLIVTL